MADGNEKLEDLQFGGLKIFQSVGGYRFTSDSVLLANLCEVAPGDRVVELGSGSGVISILIAKKFNPEEVVGAELQKRLAEMSRRSVEYNGLSDKIKIFNIDVRGASEKIGGNFDVAVANPPYEPAGNAAVGGNLSEDDREKAICRYETNLSAADCVEEAAKLLRHGGKLFLTSRTRRLADVICAMRENGIEPKKLYLVQPKKDRPCDTFIIAGKRGGKPSLAVPPPVVVHNEDGSYTEFVRRLYNIE